MNQETMFEEVETKPPDDETKPPDDENPLALSVEDDRSEYALDVLPQAIQSANLRPEILAELMSHVVIQTDTECEIVWSFRELAKDAIKKWKGIFGPIGERAKATLDQAKAELAFRIDPLRAIQDAAQAKCDEYVKEKQRRMDEEMRAAEQKRLEADRARIAEERQKQAEEAAALAEAGETEKSNELLNQPIQVAMPRTPAPVAAKAAVPKLAGATPVTRWYWRFKGETPEEVEQSKRAFFLAIGKGEIHVDFGMANCAALNRRATDEKQAFSMPGLEVYSDSSLRSK